MRFILSIAVIVAIFIFSPVREERAAVGLPVPPAVATGLAGSILRSGMDATTLARLAAAAGLLNGLPAADGKAGDNARTRANTSGH